MCSSRGIVQFAVFVKICYEKLLTLFIRTKWASSRGANHFLK